MRLAVGNPGAEKASVYLNGKLQAGVQLADTDAGYVCKYLAVPTNVEFMGPPPKYLKNPQFIHLRGLVQIQFHTPNDPKLGVILEEYYKTEPAIAEDWISPYGDITCYACGELIDKLI